uniref:Uncharacterized protein n=1 Tax=Vespula pensylvanica TaxID=30213 RepID=A0A834JKE0_VESPE|nr:hypothetical protein H0235_017580 [Vespula pensylvanica]
MEGYDNEGFETRHPYTAWNVGGPSTNLSEHDRMYPLAEETHVWMETRRIFEEKTIARSTSEKLSVVEIHVSSLDVIGIQVSVNSAPPQYFWAVGTAFGFV